MRNYIYPAVVYFDKKDQIYTLYIKDVGIIVQGDTVEEAFNEALQSLESYCKVSLRFSGKIEDASQWNEIKEKYTKEIVLLVSAKA